MFDLLGQTDHLINGRSREALQSVEQRHGSQVAYEVGMEFRALCDQGHFRQWIEGPSEEDDERTVENLLRKSTNKIQLYVSAACNMSCRYCYATEMKSVTRSQLMTREVAEAALDLLFRRARGFPSVSVTFFGGEPLVNRDLILWAVEEVERRAKASGQETLYSLTTNATLLDDEMIALIKRHNFGLMISMDGPPDVQNANRPMRDGSDSFDLVADKVKQLMRRRRRVTARVTLSHLNTDKIRIVDFLEGFGFTRVGPSIARGTAEGRWGVDLTDEDMLALEEQEETLWQRWLEKVIAEEPTPYNPYVESIKKVLFTTVPRVRCGVCRGTTAVDVDGRLYPCHRYVGMEPHCFGDVWKGPDPDHVRAYYRGYIGTLRKCRSCWAQKLCGGVCPWYTSKRDGEFLEPDDAYCDAVRRHFVATAARAVELRERAPDYYREKVLEPAEQEWIAAQEKPKPKRRKRRSAS
jgi:uncharacterized protein